MNVSLVVQTWSEGEGVKEEGDAGLNDDNINKNDIKEELWWNTLSRNEKHVEEGEPPSYNFWFCCKFSDLYFTFDKSESGAWYDQIFEEIKKERMQK